MTRRPARRAAAPACRRRWPSSRRSSRRPAASIRESRESPSVRDPGSAPPRSPSSSRSPGCMPSGRRCDVVGAAGVRERWSRRSSRGRCSQRCGSARYAAGGADSFGYLSQAQLFAHGRLTDTMPRHEGFDWPDVPATLTPLAYTRNAVPDVLVPVYPPGLSLMMAPLTLIHANAVFLLVAVVRRVDRVAHGRARARDDRAGGWRARGAARRREPDVPAAGGAADERRAGRRALALRPRPRAPAVNRGGDSGRRRLVAGHSRAAQPGAAAPARRGGVRHG